MTLTEYKAWLDGMIAATGDEHLKAARSKLDEVAEIAPVVAPSPPPLNPAPYWPHHPTTSPYRPWWMDVTCSTQGHPGDPVTSRTGWSQ